MVTPPVDPVFIAEATRIGRRIEELAVRHEGRASWVADDIGHAGVRRVFRTLDADLAGGTSGVGWFLARLAAVTGDADFAALAAEALRGALDRGPSLIADRRCGWYDGALGVAWAAVDAGAALAAAELSDAGVALANDAIVQLEAIDVENPALVGGAADVITGLLGLADLAGDRSVLDTFDGWSDRLAATIPADHASSHVRSGAPGLARGTTGIALALAAWAAATGQHGHDETAMRVLRAERAWYEPGVGWYSQPGHEQQVEPHVVEWSWCGGAAGIGLVHLAAYVRHGDVADLAELTAAIEAVRGGLSVDDGFDPSLCHGASGGIDLLLSTGATLGEAAHVEAAQRAGLMLSRQRQRLAGAPGDDGPSGENPSLLYGAAGAGLLMLRLADHGQTPSPTLPPFLISIGGRTG